MPKVDSVWNQSGLDLFWKSVDAHKHHAWTSIELGSGWKAQWVLLCLVNAKLCPSQHVDGHKHHEWASIELGSGWNVEEECTRFLLGFRDNKKTRLSV